jgi:flagellar hook-associated protein FlgK
MIPVDRDKDFIPAIGDLESKICDLRDEMTAQMDLLKDNINNLAAGIKCLNDIIEKYPQPQPLAQPANKPTPKKLK